MEEKIHTLINQLLVDGENEITGRVSSIHQTKGLQTHLSSIQTIMVKIKPGIFNRFTKQMILSYLESLKLTHTPLETKKEIVINQNITNT